MFNNLGGRSISRTRVRFLPPPPAPPAEITFNRPFLFAIVDEPTGAIVFLGRVPDPSAF
jgi:serine protease inhibitor